MRIVGGRFKGHGLKGPSSSAIRPSSDRLRETLFNILAHAYGDPVADAQVIDLFAGTGALGFEALSRGARFALFVDDGAEARAILRANVEALGVGGATRVFRRDARALGRAPAGAAYDLAFLDPPYAKNLADPALICLRDNGWLAPGALVVVEEAAGVALTATGYESLEARDIGDSRLHILRAP
jgi:16S rRNA (guanine966-N2)-methyltransferase